MKTKNGIKIFAILLLAILLLIGGWLLYSLRYQGSDIYPYYSTFRSDRMGTKVLYESLSAFDELKVKRNFRHLDELKENKENCVFVLGSNPFTLDMNLKEIEDCALSGGRVIISFESPRHNNKEHKLNKKKPKKKACESGKCKKATPKSKKNTSQKTRIKSSGVRLEDLKRNIKLPSQAIAKIPSLIPDFKVFSRNCFEIKRGNWNVLATLKGKPAVIEKTYSNGGSIILFADSYAFSNEALAKEKNAELILFLIKGRKNIIFDETHLGAQKSRNLIWLAKKFNLMPFLFALIVTLLLFIWRSLLLPYNSSKIDKDESLTEDFSKSSLVNMLRANYPVKALIKECWNEFNSSRSSRTISKRKLAALKEIVTEKGKSVDIYNNLVNEYKKREGLQDD